MAELFDDICRTLATPMSRSRALKLILGGLAGAALAPFAFGQSCPGRQTFCSGATPSSCCPQNQICCTTGTGGAKNFCCPAAYGNCCGNVCCKGSCSSGVCCGGPSPTAACR